MDSCVITGNERATPMLKFDVCGVEFQAHGLRQNNRGVSTISNTVTTATRLQGVIRRKI